MYYLCEHCNTVTDTTLEGYEVGRCSFCHRPLTDPQELPVGQTLWQHHQEVGRRRKEAGEGVYDLDQDDDWEDQDQEQAIEF